MAKQHSTERIFAGVVYILMGYRNSIEAARKFKSQILAYAEYDSVRIRKATGKKTDRWNVFASRSDIGRKLNSINKEYLDRSDWICRAVFDSDRGDYCWGIQFGDEPATDFFDSFESLRIAAMRVREHEGRWRPDDLGQFDFKSDQDATDDTEQCHKCQGAGWFQAGGPNYPEDCDACGGSGFVRVR